MFSFFIQKQRENWIPALQIEAKIAPKIKQKSSENVIRIEAKIVYQIKQKSHLNIEQLSRLKSEQTLI